MRDYSRILCLDERTYKQRKDKITWSRHLDPKKHFTDRSGTVGKGVSGITEVKISISSRSNINKSLLTRTWPYDWITQVDELKILGITFSPETKTTVKNNWQRQFNIIQNVLIKNTHRHFTFYGRVLFIKQHVLSHLVHIAHIYSYI